VVVDLVHDSITNARGSARSPVVLDDGLAAGLPAGAKRLERGEALDALGGAELLVGIVVAVHGGNVGQPVQVAGGLLVGRLEVLAVAAPRRIELDDLQVLVLA
jgi:hypothetical protein